MINTHVGWMNDSFKKCKDKATKVMIDIASKEIDKILKQKLGENMNEVINKLENDLGIPFYYVSREEGQAPVVVYNYKKEINISDMEKESASYDFYFILIINSKINTTVEKFEEILINNLFRDVIVNQSATTKEGYIQISITASKNI